MTVEWGLPVATVGMLAVEPQRMAQEFCHVISEFMDADVAGRRHHQYHLCGLSLDL
jgi:hypothetical protein